ERIRGAIVRRRDWARDRGAHFLFVVAPNKSSIYPEFLPDSGRLPNRPSRLDQVLDDLREHTDVEFVDLRPSLLGAKALGPVYYRFDTHWNDRGLVVAGAAILDQLRAHFRDMPRLDRDECRFEAEPGRIGDLARMLANVPPLEEDWIRVLLPGPSRCSPA